MSHRSELDRLDQDEQDHFDLYGYPDPPWVEAEQEWRDEQEAFERESRYFDAPPEPRVPFRATDTDELMASLGDQLKDAA